MSQNKGYSGLLFSVAKQQSNIVNESKSIIRQAPPVNVNLRKHLITVIVTLETVFVDNHACLYYSILKLKVCVVTMDVLGDRFICRFSSVTMTTVV